MQASKGICSSVGKRPSNPTLRRNWDAEGVSNASLPVGFERVILTTENFYCRHQHSGSQSGLHLELLEVFKCASPGDTQAQSSYAQSIKLDSLGGGGGGGVWCPVKFKSPLRVNACMLNPVQLFVTLWTVAHQALLSMYFFQARILERVTISAFRGFSWPRDRTCISYFSCIGRWVLHHYATWEAPQRSPICDQGWEPLRKPSPMEDSNLEKFTKYLLQARRWAGWKVMRIRSFKNH